jgi:hypothetical protein
MDRASVVHVNIGSTHLGIEVSRFFEHIPFDDVRATLFPARVFIPDGAKLTAAPSHRPL